MKKTKMLKKNYEFRAVLTKGKCFKEKQIEIFILKNNKKRNFLGIAISTKSGKAVQRNRAKRIIRECYTKLEEKIIDGNSIVILINRNCSIEKITYSAVFQEMDKILKIANISSEKEDKI